MVSENPPYDVQWEALSLEADSYNEAAQKAMNLLQQELSDTGRLRFVVQQPDVDQDEFFEVDVTPNGEVV